MAKKSVKKTKIVTKTVTKTIKPKKVLKKTTVKKFATPRVSIQKVQVEMQPILVQNFITLQRVMVNLSEKFDNLNTQMTKMLDLFETSAKTLAKKDYSLGKSGEESKEVM